MKCPECGFECLPGDLECLACGVHIGSALENKEKERIRAIEAIERKAQYELELKKELGLIPSEEEKITPVQGNTLEETFKKKPSCPKCGAERKPDALECVRCGVIFDKFKYGSNNVPSKSSGSSSDQKSLEESTESVKLPSSMDVFDADKTDEINLETLDLLLKEHPKEPHEDGTSGPGLAVHPVHVTGQDPKDTDSSVKPVRNSQEIPADEGVDVPKAPRSREFNIRSFQKKESTWDIYRNKIVQRSGHVMARIRGFWSWFEQTCGSRNKALASTGIALIVLVILSFSPAIYNWTSSVYQGFQEKAELKRQKNIASEFLKNKDGITNKIIQELEKGNFEEAEKVLSSYDVPPLKKELSTLKNYYEEKQIFRTLGQIPRGQFESLFKTYARLAELNPQNESYRQGLEKARLDYAESLYAKAVGFHNTGKKDPERLDQGIRLIKKAVEVMPGASKYQDLKFRMIKEKLLFYDGNDKIAMAVRDDGMGQRLFSGQRKISVWILNRSQERIFINVQYFTMLGKNGLKYTYNDTGSKLSGKLEPGEQTFGELYFRTGTSPAKLTFNHLVCGKIFREFP